MYRASEKTVDDLRTDNNKKVSYTQVDKSLDKFNKLLFYRDIGSKDL